MRLGSVLRKWRTMEEKGLREVAKDIGVSAATLQRMEWGYDMDAATLMKLLVWLTSPTTSPAKKRYKR